MAYRNTKLETKDISKGMFQTKFFEHEINYKRIEKLVTETIDKLSFAMKVPQLVDNDYESIKIHLEDGQMEKLQKVFKNYLPKEKLWLRKKTNHYSKLTSYSVEKIQKYFNNYNSRRKIEDYPQRDEYEFNNALHLLYDNEQIRNISETNRITISEVGFNFIQDMKLFLYSLIDKMKMTPKQAEIKEAYLREMSNHHRVVAHEVNILKEEIPREFDNTKNILEKKMNDLLDIKKNIYELLDECKFFVEHSASKTNDKIIDDWNNSLQNQKKNEQKMKDNVDLELLRKKYLKEEKELRTHRSKTQRLLHTLVKKYDKDMIKKQTELDSLKRDFEMQKEKFKQLFETSEYQEKIYKSMMLEKREEKLHELKCTLAARKLQKHFRIFRIFFRHMKMNKRRAKKVRIKAKEKRILNHFQNNPTLSSVRK